MFEFDFKGYRTKLIYLSDDYSYRSQMSSHIIALLGSPLPSGNTAKLLDNAIRGAEETGCTVTKVMVPELKFSPCEEINNCLIEETCFFKDDITPLYHQFKTMDGLIIATPIMTMGVPGALKSFMDRFQVFYNAKYERKMPLVPKEKRHTRKTLLISISGLNLSDNFVGLKMSVDAFCDIIDCKVSDELLIRDMDTKKDLTQYPDLLDEAYQKGLALGKGV